MAAVLPLLLEVKSKDREGAVVAVEVDIVAVSKCSDSEPEELPKLPRDGLVGETVVPAIAADSSAPGHGRESRIRSPAIGPDSSAPCIRALIDGASAVTVTGKLGIFKAGVASKATEAFLDAASAGSSRYGCAGGGGLSTPPLGTVIATATLDSSFSGDSFFGAAFSGVMLALSSMMIRSRVGNVIGSVRSGWRRAESMSSLPPLPLFVYRPR
mmetsp:Transcript_50664/g.107965  ORF Transcript_50664/g.107965 Transcript_50664/m.107965 type:complete len:213 (-) Transcript_50664:2-640(-)